MNIPDEDRKVGYQRAVRLYWEIRKAQKAGDLCLAARLLTEWRSLTSALDCKA